MLTATCASAGGAQSAERPKETLKRFKAKRHGKEAAKRYKKRLEDELSGLWTSKCPVLTILLLRPLQLIHSLLNIISTTTNTITCYL